MCEYLNMTTNKPVSEDIINLSEAAQQLASEIYDASPLALQEDFSGSDAWFELQDADCLNLWTDDAGERYVEIGRQQ